MKIKKLLVLQLLMVHSLTQADNSEHKQNHSLMGPGILISALVLTGYLWATSGDSVEQRIKDAQNDIATMSEYEEEFDITPILGEKESQIISVLKLLNIDLNNITKEYDQKLRNDTVTLQKVYNNLWFKSFYGGFEIATITRKVAQYRKKAQAILEYLKQHQQFINGYQIIHESAKLSHKSLLVNKNEIIKLAQSNDPKSLFPLFTYVKKLQKDLECIDFLMTQKNAQKDYPELSLTISNYQAKIEEIKSIISFMEEYKHEALAKLENDITLLHEKHQKLETLVKQLQVDIAIAKMR